MWKRMNRKCLRFKFKHEKRKCGKSRVIEKRTRIFPLFRRNSFTTQFLSSAREKKTAKRRFVWTFRIVLMPELKQKSLFSAVSIRQNGKAMTLCGFTECQYYSDWLYRRSYLKLCSQLPFLLLFLHLIIKSPFATKWENVLTHWFNNIYLLFLVLFAFKSNWTFSGLKSRKTFPTNWWKWNFKSISIMAVAWWMSFDVCTEK